MNELYFEPQGRDFAWLLDKPVEIQYADMDNPIIRTFEFLQTGYVYQKESGITFHMLFDDKSKCSYLFNPDNNTLMPVCGYTKAPSLWQYLVRWWRNR